MFTKKSIVITLVSLLVIISYLARDVIMPFILAAGFAYIFNPVVRIISRKTNLNRFWSVVVLYTTLLLIISYAAFWVTNQVFKETSQVASDFRNLANYGQDTIEHLPEWTIAGKSFGFQTLVISTLNTFVTTALEIQDSIVPILTGAVGFIIKLLLFVMASFYFLKDGPGIKEKFLGSFSPKVRKELKELINRINIALGGYLRGQVILIAVMGFVSSLALSILGVKFALTFGILTGFLELIPFIGPVVATSLVAGISFLTANNNFSLSPTTLAVVIIIIYFVLRQLEDYFVIPQLLGRMTRLHPLLVLFSIIVGGSIAGPIGFILGVPIAACARILLEYSWERSK